MTETGDNGFGKRVGGRLCLDFVNTVGGRIDDPDSRRERDYSDLVVREWLVSYESLLRWGTMAGALPDDDMARTLAREASARPSHAATVLKRAIRMRDAMYRVFKAAIGGRTPEPDDLATLNREVRVARTRERLVASPRFGWEWDAPTGRLDRVLWPVARSAAELLASADLDRVGQCPGQSCGWLFLDTSRSGRRRWCDMADCGNLEKVRRFRREHGRTR